jgi:two-component sensor histidine kinase
MMLTRWERSTGALHRYDHRDGLPTFNWVNVFAESPGGELWLGMHNGGLVRQRASRFEQFAEGEGMPEGMGQGLYFDRAGRLWVATRGGKNGRIDDPSAARPRSEPFAEPGLLASDNLRCFVEDERGNIYVGTARGVDRFDPRTGQVKHLTTAEGLAKSEVMKAFRDSRGTLWFGTRDGLSRLLPEPERPEPPPPILISGMRISGVPHPISELGETSLSGLVLQSHQNQIEIDFFGLSFSAGENLRYQYRFEGVDRDWSPPTDQRTVAASLTPGTYRFLVRAVNTEGVTSATSAVISFRILRPIWQRWWFILLAALLFAALIYLVYRYRVAQLLQVERVRTRIATDLHDDIGASLSRMAILSEVVKHQNGGTGEAEGLLTEIAESARGLVDSMSDIVWSIDPRRDDLRSVVQRVRQFASDVLEAKGIGWEFRLQPEVEKVKIGPEQRRHLYLIFKEGINNVVRHADGAKNVSLSLALNHQHLVGEIRDDGCGFTPRPPGEINGRSRGGNGLVNMRARAEEVKGRVEIESVPARGTTLKLILPLKGR